MANTTFNGPVRSQNGFQDISIDATTGTVTTDSTYATDATIGGSAKVTDGISNKTGVVAATGTILQMANGFSAALVKNTHYLTPADGNAITATLPAQADSEEGDSIIIDIPNRSIQLEISDEEMTKRRHAMEAKGDNAWQPVNRDRVVSQALQAYAVMTTSAARGK